MQLWKCKLGFGARNAVNVAAFSSLDYLCCQITKSEEFKSFPALDGLKVEQGLVVTFLGDQNKSFCGCEQGLVCECCVWAAIERKAERDALKATLKDRNSFAAGSSGEKKKKKAP